MEMDEVDKGDTSLVVRVDKVGPLSRPYGPAAAPVVGRRRIASDSAAAPGKRLRSGDIVGDCSAD